jgi:hypothetical protein
MCDKMIHRDADEATTANQHEARQKSLETTKISYQAHYGTDPTSMEIWDFGSAVQYSTPTGAVVRERRQQLLWMAHRVRSVLYTSTTRQHIIM